MSEHLNSPLLSVANVAERLGVSVASVRRWCASGRLPAIAAGGSWRIDAADLAAWLEDRTRARVRYVEPEYAVPTKSR